MRFPSIIVGFLLVAPTLATFHKDVVRLGSKKASAVNKKERSLESSFLSKAVPFAEYEAKMGGKTVSRRAEDAENMFSFSGYSMKYAKCQPVQYFSDEAVQNGMSSPMVSEDIVILRLCPESSCTESAEYGCHYNYAEYALSLTEYLRTMMEYKQEIQESTCQYCEGCFNTDNQERRLEDQDGDGEDNGEDGEDNEQDDEEDEQQDNENQKNEYNADDGYTNCGDDFTTYCSDYEYMCADQENDNGNNNNNNNGYNGYNFEQFEEYMECTQVAYNDYAYFVKPTCNGYTGAIEFAVFYDDYCVESASGKVTVNGLNLGLSDSIFYQFYDGACIDCSESEYAPFYDSNSNMCNELHQESAKCTSGLMYDLFDGEEDGASDCSFIESLRFGAYDEAGQLTSFLDGSSWSYAPTTEQNVLLGVSIALSVIFIIYACYLHHAMTNLLIKSLSHRELLPPSRHSSRRAPTKGRRSSGGRSRKVGDEGDWGEDP